MLTVRNKLPWVSTADISLVLCVSTYEPLYLPIKNAKVNQAQSPT